MYWSWFRLAAAAAGVSAIAAGFIVNVDRAMRYGQSLSLVLANYFSLFTIVSTSLAVIALIAAAGWSRLHPGDSPEPRTIALAMAGVTGPVLLLGVVYNVLLRGAPSLVALEDSSGIRMLDTYAVEVLHVVLPLYLLADLLFAPRRRGLSWRTVPVLMGYPVVWLMYTLVRGELVMDPSGVARWWYPYPFLDPHGPGGWPSVLLHVVAILVTFAAISVGIVAIGRHRERRAGRTPAESSADMLVS